MGYLHSWGGECLSSGQGVGEQGNRGIVKLLLPKSSQHFIICLYYYNIIYLVAAVNAEYVNYHNTNGMNLDKFKINQGS